MTVFIFILGEVTVMKNCDYKSSIFHVDPTQPLWLFFNVIGSVSEVRLVGKYFLIMKQLGTFVNIA